MNQTAEVIDGARPAAYLVGHGPLAYRVGRHIRYDPAALRIWLDTQDAYGR